MMRMLLLLEQLKTILLVAISTGLLNSMTEEEAEAVLAHEVSHIANGDMVTMTLLQGVLNTFVIFLSRVIANVVASSRNGDEESRSSGILLLSLNGVRKSCLVFLASIIADVVLTLSRIPRRCRLCTACR